MRNAQNDTTSATGYGLGAALRCTAPSRPERCCLCFTWGNWNGRPRPATGSSCALRWPLLADLNHAVSASTGATATGPGGLSDDEANRSPARTGSGRCCLCFLRKKACGEFRGSRVHFSWRYSGEVETMDTRGGHIPGSLNRPFGENLDGTGRFRPPEELRAGFEALLGRGGAENLVHSCGSGVTACHNLFAMELAGLGPTRLYPGSWSEWIRDSARPINTGEAP